MKLYGSKVFVRISKVNMKAKFDKIAEQVTLLGYYDIGYGVLLNDQVKVVRYVDVLEEDVPCINMKEDIRQSENDEEEKSVKR